MRIVQYYTTHRNVGKLPTVQHFMSEGVPRSTIYNIIKNFEQGKSVKRKSGSGRKAKIMTTSRVKWLKRRMLSINQPSSRALSRILCCSHQHVTKTIRSKANLMCKKKVKGPRYSEDQQTAIKKACRKLYTFSQGKDFVIDDEKYFTMSGCNMPGNAYYYTDGTTDSVQVKTKRKFEPKVMLWLSMSKTEMSKSYVIPSTMAVRKELYIEECLQNRLIPFLNKHHKPGSFLFWPDKASSHYANATQKFMNEHSISFVPKDINPTEFPQGRPIEDFFGQLAQEVYKKGWIAKDLKQLRRRILACIRNVDFSAVQAKCNHIRKQLRTCYVKGPYACLH